MTSLKRKFFDLRAITNQQHIIESIKSFLEKHEVSRSTRVWEMLSLFEEQVSKSWDNLPRTLIYHEVLEIFEIIYTLENSQDEMIIESITKDNVDEFSGKNKKGRNTQFELFIASKYIRAGYDVKFGEPDLYFYHLENRYNIACKRPQSAKKILNRIKEASKQISLHKGFGIIAIDLTPTYIRNSKWNEDLTIIGQSGESLIWNSFLDSKRKKISELVGNHASIVHTYGGLNHKINNSYAYSLFDYALEIKENRSPNDCLHEIINRVQNVHPVC
ncbi:hypothetical protein ACLKMI_06545 [Pseudoalteromonas sp. KJ71-7]|uniref:hypothetical protein n=1 Tax=Pseudoalteromonas sp. KJ71-7 TaxID=3391824 RepID=UPI0039B0D992